MLLCIPQSLRLHWIFDVIQSVKCETIDGNVVRFHTAINKEFSNPIDSIDFAENLGK